MNPANIGGARAFNELYSCTASAAEDNDKGGDDEDLDCQASSSQKRKLDDTDSQLSLDEIQAKKKAIEDGTSVAAGAAEDVNARKIYIGSLPPSITEKPLVAYFTSSFGQVIDCKVIRDRDTGISRGFAFLTFLCETMAEAAVKAPNGHILEGRPIRVSYVQKQQQQQQGDGIVRQFHKNSGGNAAQRFLEELVLPSQTRIYIGPLDETILGADLIQQFAQFGTIQGVSRIKASDTHSRKSYGFIDYQESIAMRRAFGSKVFVKGKHVKIALSRFAMEVVLNTSTVFFFETHVFCDERELEKHFSQFGAIFRLCHMCEPSGINKSYGFVDFISADSADRATQQRTQLIPPGQYVKVSKLLPQVNLYDLFAIGDKQGSEMLKKLERSIPTEGTWGETKSSSVEKGGGSTITTKVRIPGNLVGKLIGERGKTITEISRDSKTRITIPKVDGGSGGQSVIISVIGTKENIKTAQYLMQKVLKG